jgi:RNase P/RNase MRP subunit p30
MESLFIKIYIILFVIFFMINNKNLNEVRKEISRLRDAGSEVIVHAQDDDFNRKIFENKDVDVVFGLEMHNRRDYMKQRDSGLNEVLCKLAKKNGIKIEVDLKGIQKLSVVEKAKALARVRQNIVLCRRVGVEIVVDGVGKAERRSFMGVLGGSSGQ